MTSGSPNSKRPYKPKRTTQSSSQSAGPARTPPSTTDRPHSKVLLSFATWKAEVNACFKCDISRYCGNKITHRSHKLQAPIDILFVGEAAGQSEHALGVPFVGPAGDEFENMVDLLPESISWVVTNSILCTPFTNDSLSALRQPCLPEVKECSNHLSSLITILEPKHIIALGNWAAKSLKILRKQYTLIMHPSAIMQSKHRDLEFQRATLKILQTLEEEDDA